MISLVVILFLTSIFELTACYLPARSLQRLLSMVCIVVIALDDILIFGLRPAVWTLLLAYFCVFRVINLIKLFDGRKQSLYLRSACSRSSILLAIYQLVVLGLTYLAIELNISFDTKWLIFGIIDLAILLIMFLSLRRSLAKTRPKLSFKYLPDNELPTLSVAIPARNETEDLEKCLTSLVTSDYPKLEVLVLDDCSQLKRTPEIIRQFAQNGVIFIEGREPGNSWTAKNYALEELASKANGDLIMFAGVDVRFDRKTLRDMVETKISKNKKMISFMPVNSTTTPPLRRLLIQPVRYLWELALPRRSFNRPPVLSTCWLIDKKFLVDNGSFRGISRNIVPERYFARLAALDHDGYSFVCLGKTLGLYCSKSFDEQLSTAIRTKYPLLKQRLENSAVVNLIEFCLFVAPLVLGLYDLADGHWWSAGISLACCLLASLVFLLVARLAYAQTLLLSLVTYPLALVLDICLGFYSMAKYEFGEVYWKGRNVCIPVMQIDTEVSMRSILDSAPK